MQEGVCRLGHPRLPALNVNIVPGATAVITQPGNKGEHTPGVGKQEHRGAWLRGSITGMVDRCQPLWNPGFYLFYSLLLLFPVTCSQKHLQHQYYSFSLAVITLKIQGSELSQHTFLSSSFSIIPDYNWDPHGSGTSNGISGSWGSANNKTQFKLIRTFHLQPQWQVGPLGGALSWEHWIRATRSSY